MVSGICELVIFVTILDPAQLSGLGIITPSTENNVKSININVNNLSISILMLRTTHMTSVRL
jgi:hypothetical protein